MWVCVMCWHLKLETCLVCMVKKRSIMLKVIVSVRVVHIDRHPATSALSPVLEEMMRLHGRLQPHLLRYRQLMSDDQDYTDRVCHLQILCCFGALYVSDRCCFTEPCKWFGLVITALVTLGQVQLVLRWFTVCGYTVLVCNQLLRPTLPSSLSGIGNEYQPRVCMYVCMYPSGKGPAYSGPIR